ncbi:hypothetical protein, partial [Myxococcus virescens]|uniref:hypothetical protein n=1 Tax=Myxococcus virescens TaxID=83456 RepID=UPI001649EB30
EAPANGTWYLDYRDAAKARQQPSIIARTKSEAEKKLRDALNDTDDAKAGRRPMRFRATRLSEAAAEMLKLREGTPSYVMDELNLRLHVLPFLGKKFLTEIAPADVEELAVQLARGGKGRKPLAPSFVQQAIRRLASVFTWTKKKLFFGDSPTREAKRPKIPKRLPKRLSDAQVVKLLSESRQWHDLFWFAATTGLREGELCA